MQLTTSSLKLSKPCKRDRIYSLKLKAAWEDQRRKVLALPKEEKVHSLF